MRWTSLGMLVLLAIESPAARPAHASSPAADPGLEAAIARALSQNPGIAEMEHRIQAARSRIPQARALTDPMLTIGVVNVPVPDVSFQQDDMTMKMIALEQRIPARGKRTTAVRIAEAELEMVHALHADHVNRLVAEVADTYFELASLDARIGIQKRSLERLERVSESVRTRYRLGQGALPDALLAGIEETKARDRLRALETQRAAAAVRFNTLQDLPADQVVGSVPLPARDRAMPDATIVAEALAVSPAIRQVEADVRRAEQALRLARLERRTDLDLMASYGERQDRDDMIGATARFNLPFARPGRIAARISEKQAELSDARSRLAITWLELSRQVQEALVALAGEAERSALYRDTILTQDETAARAAEEAYAVGKIDFQTYMQAVLAVDEDEAEAIERETAISRARARLQGATGIPFYPQRAVEEGSHDR